MKILINYYYNINISEIYYLIINLINLINNLFIKYFVNYLFIKQVFNIIKI